MRQLPPLALWHPSFVSSTDVVLLPSLGRGARDFENLGRSLAVAGYTAWAYDPPPTMPPRISLVDLANGVLDWATSCDVSTFHVGGHAFGNRLARMVTAIAPERVITLTLLAAGGYVPMDADILASLLGVFAGDASPEEHLRRVRHQFFAPGNDPSVWEHGWNATMASYQREALERVDASLWWDAVAPRVLVVQGLDDVVAVPENGRRYVEDHSEVARLVEIEHAGHAVVVEQPAAVATAVITFLRDVS